MGSDLGPADVRLVSEGMHELLPMVRTGRPEAHVSAVIRYLCISLGHFAAEDDAVEGERDYTLMELGSAFEDAVVEALSNRWATANPDRFVRPGELELDGLIGTPDLLDTVLFAVVEIKLTKLSSNWGPDSIKFWKYWVQLMAYCYMLRTTKGFLHVCHINGDYRDNRSPCYRVYEANFSIAELGRNWRMLRLNAKNLKP